MHPVRSQQAPPLALIRAGSVESRVESRSVHPFIRQSVEQSLEVDTLSPDVCEAILAEQREADQRVVREAMATGRPYSVAQMEVLVREIEDDPFSFAIRLANLITFTKELHRRLVKAEAMVDHLSACEVL